MRRLGFAAAAALVCASSVALAAGGAATVVKKPAATPTQPAPGPVKREVGALVFDGVPEIPARIPERLFQYQNARAASFFDWAPDDRGLLFTTRFGQTGQVHFVTGPGADRQQWTFFDEPVTDALFDPKQGARGFYFTRDVGGGEFYQIYWFDRGTGRASLVTDGKSRNETLAMWPRGGKLAWVSTARNGKDFDIWLKDGDAAPKLVKEVSGQWHVFDFSPDGKALLIRHYVSINESTLWVLDLASGKTTQVNAQQGKPIAYGAARFDGKGTGVFVTSDEDSEFRRLVHVDLASGRKAVIAPALKWDVGELALSRDGKQLAYTVNEGGQSALYLTGVAGATTKPGRRVALPPGVVGGMAFDGKGARLALTFAAANAPGDVHVVDVRNLKRTQWTQSEVGGLDRTTFVTPSLVEFESFDKLKVPAWVYKPKAAAAGKKVPVVISIHGGPEAQSTALFSAYTQYLVNELGVAVIYPNVRGSAGYGKSYLLLDNGVKRQDSVKDIGALLDWIAKQPDLDASRVAVYGGSYGGFMVLASLVAYGDRLRCGVDIVGISHFVTFLQNTEEYRRDLRRAEYGDERDPAVKKVLDEISPLTNAKKIRVPLFVIQGANDPRVPQSEAEQIVKTVRAVGGPVWYLLARDEGHGFRKKQNADAMTNSVTLFLEQYLLQ